MDLELEAVLWSVLLNPRSIRHPHRHRQAAKRLEAACAFLSILMTRASVRAARVIRMIFCASSMTMTMTMTVLFR